MEAVAEAEHAAEQGTDAPGHAAAGRRRRGQRPDRFACFLTAPAVLSCRRMHACMHVARLRGGIVGNEVPMGLQLVT